MLSTVITTSRLLRALGRALASPGTRVVMILALLIVASGTAFYVEVEGWSFVDALYFSVITLTTIGLGDLAPATTGGKLFTIVYALVGVGVLASFVTAVALAERLEYQEKAEHRRRRRRSQGGQEAVQGPD